MNDHTPSKSLTTIRSGGRLASIVPQTFEEVQRIASMAVAAGLGSRAWNDSAEQAIAKATAAIMHGLELGLSPMQALGGIAVINGKTTIYGDLLTAVLWSSGFKIKKWTDGEGDARIARARITRPDGEVIEASFSVDQAKKARLWDTREIVRKKGKGGESYDAPNDSAWFRFDQDMLEWKAVGRAVRAGASDATHGMMIREDVDTPIIDVEPVREISKPISDDFIPEPDEKPDTNQAETVEPTQEQPDEIADSAGVLKKLKDDLSETNDPVERLEIWEGMSELISRLSDEDQRAAEKIFEGR